MQKLKELFLSELLLKSRNTQKIAYVGVMSALLVVCNMFFEFKLAETQFSLTIFFSALSGIIVGPLFGFLVSFLGDFMGFLYNSGGYPFMPWIGIAMGVTAFIFGFIFNGIKLNSEGDEYVKVGDEYVKVTICCILSFLTCTVLINTTAFWVVYNLMKTPYIEYLFTRIFVQGQIFNSLFNFGLIYAFVPIFNKLKKILIKS